MAAAFVYSARAHDPGISTAQGEMRASGLTLTTGFAPADVAHLLPASAPRAEKWGPAEFEAVREQLLAIAPRLWEVRAGETPLPVREVRVELLPGDNVSFHVLIPPRQAPMAHAAGGRIELPSGHRPVRDYCG